ncbi:hypothetical protein ABGB17_11950 [Sphaerisporangium sp. B11E5]|uniref:hypothetical protein n=1 Tax=Sphaerisporangium sp. B11E5 TaxID=3153563 RepID=UPI00325C3FB3
MLEQRGVSREELKHSALVAVGTLLALGLLAAWSVLVPGVSAWENLVVAVIGSLRLTGPVAAAFGAWVAVRARRASPSRGGTPRRVRRGPAGRDGVPEGTRGGLNRRDGVPEGTRGGLTWRVRLGLRRGGAARGRVPGWRVLRAPLAILAVVVGAFGATVSVLAMKAFLTEQAGHLAPTGLAVGAAGLALYAVLGWIAGWALPWTLTPLAAGAGSYVLLTASPVGGPSWAARLAPGVAEPYDPFTGLSQAAFTDQALWLLGVTGALLLAWTAVVTRRPLALALAVLAVLVAGAGMARMVTRPQAVAAAEPMAYSCQEWPITVCVHPGMRAGLTELGAEFTTMAARLTGTPAAFSRVEQRSRDDAGDPGPGVVTIHVDDLAPGYADRAASEFVGGLTRPCEGTAAEGYRAIVAAWLRGHPLPAGPLAGHQAAAGWFSTLAESQRRDWLRMFYTDFATCRLHASHFGGGARHHSAALRGRPAGGVVRYPPQTPVPGSPYPTLPVGPAPRP